MHPKTQLSEERTQQSRFLSSKIQSPRGTKASKNMCTFKNKTKKKNT